MLKDLRSKVRYFFLNASELNNETRSRTAHVTTFCFQEIRRRRLAQLENDGLFLLEYHFYLNYERNERLALVV